MKLLSGGFAQLLTIVQWFAELHLENIQEAARGTLASGTGAPSEEKAIECVIRMFEGRHEEADKLAIGAYMRARTWEWWHSYPERVLLTTLFQRADRRKKWIGTEYSRRRPTPEEGVQIAEPLLASIPDKITLDVEGEYKSMVKLLAGLLMPPMGEASPEALQEYATFAESTPVYRDAVRRYYADANNADYRIFRPDIRWKRRRGGLPKYLRGKVKVPAHSPIKPALFLRNLQIQFVIGLLQRVQIPPLGSDQIGLSGCRIVGEVLDLEQETVKGIWEMPFTVEMKRQSRAVSERLGLDDTTKA